MSRRGGILEDIAKLPWPVGVVAAIVVFFVSQYFAANPPDSVAGLGLSQMLKTFGTGLAVILLLGSLISLVTQILRRNQFKTTRSIADIRSLSWRQFESLIGEYFRQEGYFVVETAEGPDNGVDLVLRKEGEKTYVQCKHWKTNQVGVEKVRELLGSMAAGGAQAGIFVTSGTYTQPARDLARDCGIELIDGAALAQLLESREHGPSKETPSTDAGPTPTCPLCNATMVKRVAQRGKNAGSAFWGCSKYPACRGTRNIGA